MSNPFCFFLLFFKPLQILSKHTRKQAIAGQIEALVERSLVVKMFKELYI